MPSGVRQPGLAGTYQCTGPAAIDHPAAFFLFDGPLDHGLTQAYPDHPRNRTHQPEMTIRIAQMQDDTALFGPRHVDKISWA